MATTVKTFEKPVRQLVAGDSVTSSAELAHRPCGGLRTLIATGFLVWSERRHAARASGELLALYRAASAIHPEFANRELYKLVVMTRTGCDATAASVILNCAQDSFAEWPVRRDLTLCDVVALPVDDGVPQGPRRRTLDPYQPGSGRQSPHPERTLRCPPDALNGCGS